MTPALHSALEAVYEEFRAPIPAGIDGCPCCVERKAVKALHSRALRELNADDLGAYAASVFLTVGEVRDFRYFLPRIFEIAVTDLGWWPSPEVVLGKLPLAGWRGWRKSEQAAVEALIKAWFDDCATTNVEAWGENDQSLDAVLCGVGRAGLDPAAYLDRLVADNREFGLCVLWEHNRQTIAKRERMNNAFWKDSPEMEALAVRRLMAPDIQVIVA